jgi:hypothetical protein
MTHCNSFASRIHEQRHKHQSAAIRGGDSQNLQLAELSNFARHTPGFLFETRMKKKCPPKPPKR